MSGGLIALVSFGNENTVINGNPQLTYFYKAFVRHTHFSIEPIQIPLEGPQQLQLDAPILVKARIPRNGDLLSDLVLRVDVPEIYSKAYIDTTVDPPTLQQTPQQFKWVRQLGLRMIDRVTFLVGGTKVQEFTSDWIAARALLDMDQSEYQKWRILIGDVPELFDPGNGIYSDPELQGGYPNVVVWPTAPGAQTNAPSIPSRRLRIPLGLWFSDYIENALPLVALQSHYAEIHIQLRPIRDLYTIRDPSGVRVRYGHKLGEYLPTDQYTGIWDPALYGPLPPTLNNYYVSYTDPTGAPRYFYTDISGARPNSDGWPMNMTLEGSFVFLTDAERKVFATRTLSYLVRQVQPFLFPGVIGKSRYEVDVHNIATRAVWFARRSDALQYRNDYLNLTNWIYTTQRPYVTPVGYPPRTGELALIGRSGLSLPGLQQRILRNATFVANGTNLFDPKDERYFTDYVPYKYLKGNTIPYENYGLASQFEMWPLHTLSFALHGSDPRQPSGTLNTSRIDKLQFDFDVEPIPIGALYTYNVSLFVESLNFLEISNGMGGLKFAI
jgi:hypothetical protein